MELYHLLNRGVEKRTVFIDETDRVRFVHDLYAFNDENDVNPNHRFKLLPAGAKREPLVDIHAFSLMPNHYHMLVSERIEGGISTFMRKLNMGYAKYFNEKYKRSGVLWQGTFRKVQIQRDAHFLYIPYYIHLNPLDMVLPEWRGGNVKNIKRAFSELEKYRWSSYLDYIGTANFPSVINQTLLSEVLGASKRQQNVIRDIISDSALAQLAGKLE
ncbi:MAG: transposase [bacterium]|nr:transposase [bacterium]